MLSRLNQVGRHVGHVGCLGSDDNDLVDPAEGGRKRLGSAEIDFDILVGGGMRIRCAVSIVGDRTHANPGDPQLVHNLAAYRAGGAGDKDV